MSLYENLKDKLLVDLKRFEGLRLKPYICSQGKLTIGYGHRITDKDKSELMLGITKEKAEEILLIDAKEAFRQAVELLNKYSCPEQVYFIIAQMCFQLGQGGTRAFKKMFAAIEKHDYRQAAQEMRNSLWHKQTTSRAEYLAKLIENV